MEIQGEDVFEIWKCNNSLPSKAFLGIWEVQHSKFSPLMVDYCQKSKITWSSSQFRYKRKLILLLDALLGVNRFSLILDACNGDKLKSFFSKMLNLLTHISIFWHTLREEIFPGRKFHEFLPSNSPNHSFFDPQRISICKK